MLVLRCQLGIGAVLFQPAAVAGTVGLGSEWLLDRTLPTSWAQREVLNQVKAA